ncbi:MAG: formylglycine-generating enzyme family protein [Polyangiaceae bacterium]|nr:formylglycine-generating enzyme family protein [Polyangiaceae bacterium]
MKRLLFLIPTLLLTLWSGCTSGESHFGSTSAFLGACEEGSCGAGDECRCEACSSSCSNRDDCAERILGPGFEATDLPDNVICKTPSCGGSGTGSESVCEVTCDVDADCNFLDALPGSEGHQCVSNQCRAITIDKEVLSSTVTTATLTADEITCPDGTTPLPIEASSICLDKYEVSVKEYRKCIDAGACPELSQGNLLTSGRDDHPINGVTAAAAESYCAANGGTLPQKSIFELAVRGNEGTQLYPWGDQAPTPADIPERLCGLQATSTCPLGEYPAGRGSFGQDDLFGNVAEWVQTESGPCFIGGDYSSSQEVSGFDCLTDSDASLRTGFRCVRPFSN